MVLNFSLQPEELAAIQEQGIETVDAIALTNKETGEAEEVFYVYSKSMAEPTAPVTEEIVSNKVVHPSHYNMGKFEVKDVIRDWDLNFNLGNAIKYIARAPYKHPDRIIEDYEKAKQYIDFEIEYLKDNQ